VKNSTFKKKAAPAKGAKRSESPRGGTKNADKPGSKSRKSTSVGSKKQKEETKKGKGGKGANKNITLKKIDADVKEESSLEDSDGFKDKMGYKRSSAKN